MSFSPADVPEIAAGYWWDAELGITDPGASTFRWAEQNGHTSADQTQATPSRQPALISANGHHQLRWDKSAAAGFGGAGSKSFSASAITAGWTGATYVCGWWRVTGPLATAVNPYFTHTSETNPTKRLALNIVSATAFRMTVSTNGSTTQTVDFAPPAVGAFLFLEFVFNPAAASGARGEFWINRVKQAITAGGITTTTIADVAANIGVACRSAATENAFVTDCGWCAYANGIPSDVNRDLLCSYKRGAPAAQRNTQAVGSHAAGAITIADATGGVAAGHASGSVTEA